MNTEEKLIYVLARIFQSEFGGTTERSEILAKKIIAIMDSE